MADALCHPDDLAGVGVSSGWVTVNSLCHPDDILFHLISSGWLSWGWYLIRMSNGTVIMSSGWDTLPFLSHSDEIANFDFPQHAMALQRFRRLLQQSPLWCKRLQYIPATALPEQCRPGVVLAAQIRSNHSISKRPTLVVCWANIRIQGAI